MAVASLSACSLINGLDDFERVEGQRPSSGSGGAGAAGGAGGAGGTGNNILAEWTVGAPEGDGTCTLPSWLVLESPSDNKTVQTGPDRVRTGFGVNAARARSVEGTTWGLNVESKRENRLATARINDTEWQVLNNLAVALTTGPDGADLAAELTDSNNQAGAMVETVTAAFGEVATFSAWVNTEASTTQASLECNACAMPNALLIDMGLSWERVSLTSTEEDMGNPQFARIRPTSAVGTEQGSAIFDLVSVETGRYPSSVILTTGAPVTREDEKLYATSASDLAPGGWFHAFMVFAPNYASDEQEGDHDLLFFNAQNRLYIRALDNAIVLQAEGTDVLETPPLTWARDQELRIEVMNLESGRTLQVTGANEGDQTLNDSTAGAFPVTGALHLLGSDGGSQECADLRSIAFYRPM